MLFISISAMCIYCVHYFYATSLIVSIPVSDLSTCVHTCWYLLAVKESLRFIATWSTLCASIKPVYYGSRCVHPLLRESVCPSLKVITGIGVSIPSESVCLSVIFILIYWSRCVPPKYQPSEYSILHVCKLYF